MENRLYGICEEDGEIKFRQSKFEDNATARTFMNSSTKR